MKVYVVLAEHWEVPGSITRAFASEEGANKECASVVNIMLKDSELTPNATANNWRDKLVRLQTLHDDEECYVTIIPTEVHP
jgi:hypothetical protein